jgi:hypothetical protein
VTIAPYDRGYGRTSADEKPAVSCRDVLVSAVRTLLHTEEVGERDTLSGSGKHGAAAG